MVLGLLGLVFLRGLFSANPIVIAVQVASALLLIWARVAFGMRSFHAAANPTEGGLVTNGPYRLIRHPIYASIRVFVWAGILRYWSVATCACGVWIVICALVRIFAEEKLVTARYPEYADYAKRTRRMIPFVF